MGRRSDAAAVLRDYYQLTKPGIIRGNLMAAGAGFLLGAGRSPDWAQFAATLAGLGMVIAGACVSNNIMDRGIDRRMARTRRRALAGERVSVTRASEFAATLTFGGTLLLSLWVSFLTAILALAGYAAYVGLYGFGKRRTVHGTLIGTISGAVPPVAGYAAASGRIDLAAGLLFLILVVWQMPHFYALAIMQRDDYKLAGIPVLPVVQGVTATKKQIVWYCAAFLAVVPLPSLFGYTGVTYAAVALALGIFWLARGLAGFDAGDDRKWARRMFRTSLAVLSVWCLLLAASGILP